MKYDTSAAVRLLTEKIEDEAIRTAEVGTAEVGTAEVGTISFGSGATIRLYRGSPHGAECVVEDNFVRSGRILDEMVKVFRAPLFVPGYTYTNGAWVESESPTITLTAPEDPLAYFNPPEPPKITARKLPGVHVVAGEWPRVQIGLKHVG